MRIISNDSNNWKYLESENAVVTSFQLEPMYCKSVIGYDCLGDLVTLYAAIMLASGVVVDSLGEPSVTSTRCDVR